MAMSVFTFLVPCWAIPLERWQCLFYFPTLCVCSCVRACACACVGDRAICMMDSHGYANDPLQIMIALDLVVWVCTQVDCCGCTFMLYCVHDHRSMIVLIHLTKWYWFPRVCDTHQHAWCFERLWLVTVEHVDTRRKHRRETLPVRYSSPNAKLYRIFVVKMGYPHCHILTSKALWE